MASIGKNKSPKKPSGSHRTSSSFQKTEIVLNVYDLLPVRFTFSKQLEVKADFVCQPGKLSSVLWVLGSSLLHTGIVIEDREYAFGGHDRRGMSGVYWTRPRLEPPGGTFRCEILQGFTYQSAGDIDKIIKDVSQEFQGTSYHLLSNNCNHFSSYLCEKLTSRPAPFWLNRAASIGIALPCVVPREWVAPPSHDTADGELLEEDEDDERAAMLRREQQSSHSFHAASLDCRDEERTSDRD